MDQQQIVVLVSLYLLMIKHPKQAGTLTWRQRRQNSNMIRRAGVRGCEAADYPCEASVCEGQKLGGGGGGGGKAPLVPPGFAALAWKQKSADPRYGQTASFHGICLPLFDSNKYNLWTDTKSYY